MSAADRLTPLGVMVLSMLREDAMHPYEMIRLMRLRRDDRILSLTNGTFYHTVARLERAGLITSTGVDRDGNRPERTTYALTPHGASAATDWVRRELVRTGGPVEFRVALAEAHDLAREEAIALLERRRDLLRADAAEVTLALAEARATGLPDQYLVEADREAALAAADLAWLDAFLGRLRDPDTIWGEHAGGKTSARYLAQRKAARE